jgi:hypothetical protein
MRITRRPPATREQIIRIWLALAWLAGVVAGFTVSVTIGLATLAALSLLMAGIALWLGQDDEAPAEEPVRITRPGA